MPRTARAAVGGVCYHAINRGNGRCQVFYKDGDYRTFPKALAHACEEIPMRVLGWCMMPNHFHLALWPHDDGDLSRWMHWLLNAHVRHYHRHYYSSGHVWQGRFKAFPIEQDEHLLTVLRSIERNPLRAGLVARAEEWPWSSLAVWRQAGSRPPFLDVGPVPRPDDWVDYVNTPLSAVELECLRTSVNRGRPYGNATWVQQTAADLGLQASLRPRGRPRTA